MNLSRMQDIGGLRAVVPDISSAASLRTAYQISRFKHELVADTDYIDRPKESGYRGFHIVYRYKGQHTSEYDGLLLELQIRTRVQHAWATAVETAGTFLNQSLKSSEGPDRWLEFFSVVSSVFAVREGCPPVPQWAGLKRSQLLGRLKAMNNELRIVEKLGAYRIAMNAIKRDNIRGSYHLIVLDPSMKTVTITTYSKTRLDAATRDYAMTEAEIAQGGASQAVLVAASSLEQLQRAYPNYFLDTQEFLNILNDVQTSG